MQRLSDFFRLVSLPVFKCLSPDILYGSFKLRGSIGETLEQDAIADASQLPSHILVFPLDDVTQLKLMLVRHNIEVELFEVDVGDSSSVAITAGRANAKRDVNLFVLICHHRGR